MRWPTSSQREVTVAPNPGMVQWAYGIAIIALLVSLAVMGTGCAPTLYSPEFPRMSPEQVKAEQAAVGEHPVLVPWWGDYVKAWCVAEPKVCQK
jgi:hypothetical protein